MADENDEVGYGKPPKKNQFYKGCSGNPRGRPKGSKNISTIFRQISHEKVRVTENGKTKMVTKLQACFMQLANKAAGGDLRALKEFIALERIYAQDDKLIDFETPDKEKDEIALRAVLARIRRDNPLDTSSESKQITQEDNEDTNDE